MKRRVSLLVMAVMMFIGQSSAQSWMAQSSGLPVGIPTEDMRFVAASNTVCWGVKTADNTTSNLYIRTTNGGIQWTASTVVQAPPSWRGSNITAVYSNVAWIAMHDPSGAASGGIFRTTNGGTDWTQQTTAFPGSGGYVDFIHFFDSGNGVCVGNPHGRNWEIYTTTDGGNLWTRVDSSNIPPPMVGESAFFDYAAAGNSLWFCTNSAALYRSTNRGATWTVNRSIGGAGFVPAFQDTATGRFSRFVPGNQVWATTDGGTTWTETGVTAPTGFTSFFMQYVTGTTASYVITSASGISSGTPGSAFTGDGGATWTRIDNTVSRGPSSFASAHAGWCGGANDSVYKWVPPRPPAGLQLWLRADAGVDTLNGKVSRWRDQSGKGNDAIQSDIQRQPLFVDSALNHKPVLRFDGWDDKLGFTSSTPMSQFTLFMVVKNGPGDGAPGGGHLDHVINFGPSGGDLDEWFFVLFGGLDRLSDRIGMGEGSVANIQAVAPNIAALGEWRIISIMTNQTILNTTVRWNGSNATMVPSTPDMPYFGPMGNPTGSGGGLAGADGLPNGGAPRVTAKCDFAEVILYDTVLADPQRLAIERDLNVKYNIVTGVNEQQGKPPQQFVLEQNYPNPFNPSTTIHYALPYRSHVTLTVFNTLGQKVAELINGEMDAGHHEVRFDGSRLASGVYFYRIQAGGYVETKKLCFIR